jgi:predicted enzyme related to lactoylglutathione lyase
VRFGWTIVYVADVAATVEFYERAFGLQRRFVAEDGTYAELETGATTLGFAAESLAAAGGATIRPNRPAETAAGFDLALVTDAVEADFERAVAAGAVVVAPPAVKPWGQTVAYLRDINGVLVEVCSPVSG